MSRRPRPLPAAAALVLAAAAGVSGGGGGEAPRPGEGWRELRFAGVPATSYRNVAEDGRTVLLAAAEGSASLLYARVAGSLEATPVLRWHWRVDRLPAGGDVRRRAADDAGARVYVGFRYRPALVPFGQRLAYWLARMKQGEYPPYSGIAYVWAASTPVGTRLLHPDYPRLLLVVVRSGSDRLGTWVEEERDVLADAVAAFGAPPPPISHLGVMTDADDTRSSAAARYGEIRFEETECRAGLTP
ncbi:MAG: DUF3047 domain-containing protein [Thermoanaerobaculaceae bacterium]|nr:DUF3047 domain-containing protein [Thermoanaerobaculaceae bacterium]TAM53141.1 MAG: DUF3047 domain-containing protein [Acidobacteriota bacterium]